MSASRSLKFLSHSDDRARKAGEIWPLARQDRFAKLDVCNEATERDVTAARSASNKRA